MAALASLRRAFSLIMKTNCYELTPVEFDGKYHFIIQSEMDHQISVLCYRNGLHSISISGHTGYSNRSVMLEVKFRSLYSPAADYEINGVKLLDWTIINPRPMIRHCLKLVEDLHLSDLKGDPVIHVVKPIAVLPSSKDVMDIGSK